MDEISDNQTVANTPARVQTKRRGGTAEQSRADKIRVELNVEKWPGMWRPASSKTAPTTRVLEREVQLADGTRGTAKLEIGFTQRGTITTEDQRMFVALVEHWEDNGKPADRPVFFSDRLLARLLHKKGWGTNVITAITESLRRLRTTPLRWINSFRRNDGSDREYAEETFFQFLEDLKIITRKEHGHVTNQQGYFQFDRKILSNLLKNYTKPLWADEFFSLQTEIGQLLYTHVDLIMADKTKYERCTKELFKDLGLLENPSYRYASNRKQALRRPIAELQGKRLSTGLLKSITLERTKDNKDYKLVFVKGRASLAEAEALPNPIGANSEVVVNNYQNSEKKGALLAQAEELVQYFHTTVHGVAPAEPVAKELNQACAIIGKYGLEQGKHIVAFAFLKGQETNFPMQHFGAVLNYTSRALASLAQERNPHKQSRNSGARVAEAAAEPEYWPTGEARLAILTIEQEGVRLGRAKAELFQKLPFLAQHWNQGSKIHQDMIRSRMVKQLEHEPMALLVIGLEVVDAATQNLAL